MKFYKKIWNHKWKMDVYDIIPQYFLPGMSDLDWFRGLRLELFRNKGPETRIIFLMSGQ